MQPLIGINRASFVWSTFKGDLFGGLTAAVVALPLALAFGVSSGLGTIAGLYGAICVGLFAALFGGTPAQVSGPTGPMTVVMAAVFTDLMAKNPESGFVLALSVVVMAGALQILFGLLRLGKYITLVPFPVISGFMSGIGFIIIILQLAPLLGHPAAGGVLESIRHLPTLLMDVKSPALILGALTLTVLFVWPKVWAKFIPAALAALVLGTCLSLLAFSGDSLAIIGEIPVGLPAFHIPVFDQDLLGDMLIAALLLAALGSIDSLLTSLVADNLSKSHHDSDRELIGQGIGNMVAGFMGGLPGAGATMRTVVNLRAGGHSPLSGVIHALILLLVVLGAGGLAENIPHAVLAGILIKVGFDIIDWKFLQRLHRAPLYVVCLMLLVLVLTVTVDLVTAVLAGVFIANVITVKQLADAQVAALQIINSGEDCSLLNAAEAELIHRADGRILLYVFSGPISYGAAKGIRKKLQQAADHDALVLDFEQVPMIDISTALALEDMILDSQEQGREVLLIGVNNVVHDELDRMQILHLLPADAVHQTRVAALDRAYSGLV